MEPEFALPLRLPEPGSRRLLQSLHEQLRAAIVAARLEAGTRLPPTRAFATAYGVSRNTALAIYDRLASEGYLMARGKAGTFVAALTQRSRRAPSPGARAAARLNPRWRDAAPPPRPSAAAPRYDFRFGVPEMDGFPAAVWRRLSARAWRAQSREPASYGDPQGELALRRAIASHVSFARAVACGADDVVVTAGAQQAFDLLARVLVTPGRTQVAVENPGYPPARAAFACAGARIADVGVDADGIRVDRIPAAARVVYATPSHQFPLGVALSAPRRAELLALARRRGAVVVEDDYDGEFRFAGRPLDALQTLDRDDAVFYVGTFSKSLFPGLRLGYVIAPPWARAALAAAKHAADGHCPAVEQAALAAFIGEGHLARHVRRLRRVYAARRARLIATIERDFAPWLQLQPSLAGLHVTALARAPLDVAQLVRRARERDVGLHALRPYYRARGARDGLVFAYGAIAEASIAEALARLRGLLPRRAGVSAAPSRA